MKRTVLLIPFLALAACVTSPSGGNLSGNIVCENCAAIPSGAIVTVQLMDNAIADAPAKILSEQVLTGPLTFPFKYKIHYWDAQITMPYMTGVFVTVRHNGNLIYWTDTANAPFDNGAKPKTFDVKVVKAR